MSDPPTHEDLRDKLIASGGFMAPSVDLYGPRLFAVVTMKPWRQRWRLWLRGQPTFDVDVYDRNDIPKVADMLPSFKALRGGVSAVRDKT